MFCVDKYRLLKLIILKSNNALALRYRTNTKPLLKMDSGSVVQVDVRNDQSCHLPGNVHISNKIINAHNESME